MEIISMLELLFTVFCLQAGSLLKVLLYEA